ncbi:T9SS type A sorting domain-containing protein [Kaistella jeonii]|uniref:Secretion system C-terminal sorting domain-containing protein n=1 Tax=Kaistella jeonii TaxID=266749 RepID=A0A0C1CVU8_9FLAO|nr:T9SS type A sorting domain-containing protein [Kaistella jeonii]KIA88461.1 hypothetical protein OA86_10510 [Kaistella jeonii]SFC17577.1 Por secretion system C-terminal sorting domain-containing protein [Kaistella jeonii]VEI95427.1 Por secretion system C-terminal sorting domain [Kaistella jeonii]
MTKKFILSLLAVFGCLVSVLAQQSILAMNSSTKKVIQLNASDGSVLNASFIDASSISAQTIKGITQVDNKIWISDQLADAIYIYSFNGTYQSTISGGLDNLRGLNIVNNEVWVTNEGTANGATANSIVRFSKAGVNLGVYPTITSPFDVLDLGSGNALVSSFSTNGIAKISYNGTVSTAFVASGVVSNPEQMNFNSSGNVIVAVFSSLGNNLPGIYEFSPAGVLLNKWPISTGSVRGVIAAGNGNYLVSTSTGIYSLNPATSISTLITAGNFQFFTKIDATLAVNEGSSGLNAQFYPNPITDFLNVSNKEEIDNVMIYSVTGQLQIQQKLNEKSVKLDLSKLSAGMYILKIQDKSSKTQTVKIIKK